jgi:hypothetical protein
MAFVTLLPELYYHVTVYLTCRDLFNLGLSHKRAHEITDPILYLSDARSNRPSALVWAALAGREKTNEKALKAYRQTCPHHDSVCTCTFRLKLIQALAVASICQHIGIIRAILDNGVDVDARHRSLPGALEIAAKSGNSDIVELLLEKNVNVNATEIGHPSALQLASF